MGKWDAVVTRLDPLPAADQSYQDGIDAIKKHLKQDARIIGEILSQMLGTSKAFKTIEGQFKDPLVFETQTPESLAKMYGEMRVAKELLKTIDYFVQQHYTALEQMLIESADSDEPGWGMYGAKPNAVRLPNGESVAVQWEPSAAVEDKDAYREWCIANGYGPKLQLWLSTTNSIVKERLEEGQALPDGVKAYARPTIVWRKGK